MEGIWIESNNPAYLLSIIHDLGQSLHDCGLAASNAMKVKGGRDQAIVRNAKLTFIATHASHTLAKYAPPPQTKKEND